MEMANRPGHPPDRSQGPDTEDDDQFDRTVAISGDTVVVSTLEENSNQMTITNGTTASADNSTPDYDIAYVSAIQ